MRRPVRYLAVNRSLAWNHELAICWAEFVFIVEASQNFQMHFRHTLAFRRHVQLRDHLLTDRFDFQRHSWDAIAAVSMSQDNRTNIAPSRQPFAIVSTDCAPARRLRVVDLFR